MLAPKVQILVDEVLLFRPYGVSRADFWSFIITMRMRNRTMGIPALEDGVFVNLFICNYLYVEIGGAGYCSVDRESWSYELTLVVGSCIPLIGPH